MNKPIKVKIVLNLENEQVEKELLSIFKNTIKGHRKNNRTNRKRLKMAARRYVRNLIGVIHE